MPSDKWDIWLLDTHITVAGKDRHYTPILNMRQDQRPKQRQAKVTGFCIVMTAESASIQVSMLPS